MSTRQAIISALPALLSLALVVAACGSAPDSTASATPTGAGGAQANAVIGSAPAHPPSCTIACTSAADCGVGGGLADQNHFRCTSGRCEWLGCKSKTDCTSAYQSQDFICVKASGDAPPDCIHTCSAAADCAPASATAKDVSHFQCNSGRCQFLGCQSNAECSAAFHSDKFVCSREGGSPIPQCVLACSAPADCVAPGGEGPDASRFTCQNKRCNWLGCRSSAECKTLYHNDKLVCE